MAGNWMDWLKGINTGAPGGPMGPGQMPQAGGMPQAPQMPPMPGAQPAPGSVGPGPQPMPEGGGMRMPGGGGQPPGGGLGAGIGASLPPAQPAPRGPQQGNMNANDAAQADLYTTLIGLQPQENKVKRAQALAAQLRQGAAMPQAREARGQTVAAHPLEFLSSLAHAGGAAYKQSQADADEDAYGRSRREALDLFRQRQGLGSLGQ